MTHQATDTASAALLKLIQKWRGDAHRLRTTEPISAFDEQRADAREEDADELEAALASLPAPAAPEDPYAKVREVFTAAGRCRWHDTLLVQMVSGPHVGSYFCAVCALEGRSTFDGAVPAAAPEEPVISSDLRKHLDAAHAAVSDIRNQFQWRCEVRDLTDNALHEIKEAMLLAYPDTVAAPEEEK